MSVSAITAPPLPLLLRSGGQEATVSQAKGFGATAAPEVIARITADMFATFAASQTGSGSGSVSAGIPSANADKPDLRAPDMSRAQHALGESAKRLSPDGMLALLIGKLQQQLGNNSLEGLRQRLLGYQHALQARAASGAHLAKALENALANAEAADAAAREAASLAESAQAAAEAARDEAARLQAELEQMAEDDPGYPAKKSELQAAQQARSAAEARYQQAAQKALEAGTAYNRALEEVEAQRRSADGFNAGQPLGLTPPNQKIDAKAKLHELIARLSQIMSDHSLEKLQSESEALMAQLKAREAENLQRAKQHEEEQQRARDAEKKTGCVGKIFQWVGAAVAAVASVAVIAIGVLTANPALIIGGIVGMALTIDTMVGMATGVSAMGKLTEAIGSAVAKALVAFGVSEELAKQIGMILATIAIMIALIAVAIVGGNFASAGQHLSKVVIMVKKVVEALQVLAQVANTAGTVTQGVGRIIVAKVEIELATLLAMIENTMFGNQVLREMLQQLADAVADLDRTALDLLRQMSEVQATQTAVAKDLLANIRTTA